MIVGAGGRKARGRGYRDDYRNLSQLWLQRSYTQVPYLPQPDAVCDGGCIKSEMRVLIKAENEPQNFASFKFLEKCSAC